VARSRVLSMGSQGSSAAILKGKGEKGREGGKADFFFVDEVRG
jgi:hypothetical protein